MKQPVGVEAFMVFCWPEVSIRTYRCANMARRCDSWSHSWFYFDQSGLLFAV